MKTVDLLSDDEMKAEPAGDRLNRLTAFFTNEPDVVRDYSGNIQDALIVLKFFLDNEGGHFGTYGEAWELEDWDENILAADSCPCMTICKGIIQGWMWLYSDRRSCATAGCGELIFNDDEQSRFRDYERYCGECQKGRERIPDPDWVPRT